MFKDRGTSDRNRQSSLRARILLLHSLSHSLTQDSVVAFAEQAVSYKREKDNRRSSESTCLYWFKGRLVELQVYEGAKQRRQSQRGRRLKLELRVSAIISQLFQVIHSGKMLSIVLGWNWYQRFGDNKRKLKTSHSVLTSWIRRDRQPNAQKWKLHVQSVQNYWFLLSNMQIFFSKSGSDHCPDMKKAYFRFQLVAQKRYYGA